MAVAAQSPDDLERNHASIHAPNDAATSISEECVDADVADASASDADTAEPTGQLTQAELERALWAAADILRGPVEHADMKAFILPVFAYKYFSDMFDEQRAKLEAASVERHGRVVPELVDASDMYRVWIPAEARWSRVLAAQSGVGRTLQAAFDAIEQAQPDTLNGIFGVAQWNNQEVIPERAVRQLLDHFSTIDLRPSVIDRDAIGEAYEYLLKQFASDSGKKAGEFYTPREVVRLLTHILDPQENETVYDPTCGSGGMLVEAVNTVVEHGMHPGKIKVRGQEINRATSTMARLNLLLHGIEDGQVRNPEDGTLSSPAFTRVDPVTGTEQLERFECVLANPPFSLKKWDQEAWKDDPYGRNRFGVPPKGCADYAFVEHMICSLTDPFEGSDGELVSGGRMAVVLPTGVLFRGKSEAEIRQRIIEEDLLEAVIVLPSNLFYSTSIPAVVLVIRRVKPAERRGHVLMIDASARFVKGKNQNTMSPDDIATILTAYQAGQDPDGEDHGLRLRLVPTKEIEENGWDLNIGRYLHTADAEPVDVAASLERLREARAAAYAAQTTFDAKLKAAGYE